MTLPRPLRGIIAPLITPLADQDTLDRSGLARLIEHVIGGGVDGVFLLGTTGEGPSLSAKLRRELVEGACQHIAGRVPVLVGITDSSFTDSVALACFAAQAGAQAAVSAGPLYFSAPQASLLHYFERLAEQSPLPVFMYNMPSCTQVAFEVETVVQASMLNNVAGIKDSSGNMGYAHQLQRALAATPDFTLLVGPEELLAEAVLLGAHGGVSGGANLFPRLYTSLYQAALRGDLTEARRLQATVIEVCARIFEAGSYGTHYLQGLKYAASLLGLCPEVVAMPYGQLTEEGKGRVAEAVEHLQRMAGAVSK